jgi:hypothetical protein
MSLNAISCACRLRPDVWQWYLSFCERSFAPYFSRIATDQMRRATRPSTEYSGSIPLLKKKLRFGAKSSMCIPAREVGLDEREAVAQRERELADRVRAGLGDVVARDRHRVEVLHVVVDEVLLDVAHHLEAELGREDAGVLALVLLQDVGLHGAAHGRHRPRLDLGGLVVGRVALVVVP